MALERYRTSTRRAPEGLWEGPPKGLLKAEAPLLPPPLLTPLPPSPLPPSIPSLWKEFLGGRGSVTATFPSTRFQPVDLNAGHHLPLAMAGDDVKAQLRRAVERRPMNLAVRDRLCSVTWPGAKREGQTSDSAAACPQRAWHGMFASSSLTSTTHTLLMLFESVHVPCGNKQEAEAHKNTSRRPTHAWCETDHETLDELPSRVAVRTSLGSTIPVATSSERMMTSLRRNHLPTSSYQPGPRREHKRTRGLTSSRCNKYPLHCNFLVVPFFRCSHMQKLREFSRLSEAGIGVPCNKYPLHAISCCCM